jgi:hypothetical protein
MIKQNLVSSQSQILNDHIAFRTLGVNHLGVKSFEKIFLHYGYKKRDFFRFDKKKLKASWVIYNRYYLNHYTISVHELPEGYRTLEKFNKFLMYLGVKLNDSGGLIKISKDGLLKQSSTIANKVLAKFKNNEKSYIAGSYVEFTERKVLPEYSHLKEIKDFHRRDGFETGNADLIFESTFSDQVNKI